MIDMETNRQATRKVFKGGYRVFFVYSRGREAALLDRAVERSGLSASAYFVKAGKLLARVQRRTEGVGLAEAAKTLSTLER
jgi:hypothetical protein